MKIKSALLVLAMLMLLGAPVLAQEEDDVDAPDAAQSAKDAYAVKLALTQFQQADLDKDKKLTKDEFANGKGMKGKSFEAFDSNGDSSLTLEEWNAAVLKKP